MHPVEILLTPLGRAFRNRHADESASLANAPELVTSEHFILTSPSFADGQEIPAAFCGAFIGDNTSPRLEWSGLPAGTTSLVLLMEDLNSPGTDPRIHVIAEFPPGKDAGEDSRDGALPEAALNSASAGVSFLGGRHGGVYRGPRPLPGHGPHHYRFHLYALDRAIDLASVDTAGQLPAALKGRVLASALLTGIRTS